MRTVFAVSSVLENWGVEVITGKSGKESLDKLDGFPEIDLVLLDVLMAGVDDYQAIRQVRRHVRYRDIPVIALTARAMTGDRSRCLAAGADDYLSKPVNSEKLTSMLTFWLDPQLATPPPSAAHPKPNPCRRRRMPENQEIKILVVDDKPDNLLAIEGVLDRPDLTIITATSGNDALGLVLEHNFALILMDVQMPGIDGFEVAELLRGSEKTRQIPIIFITAINKEKAHVFTGYEKGAVDYLFKPLDPLVLRCKVNIFIEMHQQRRKLQESNAELSRTVAELEALNQKIRDQQKSVIEEERLKVLLQMAGTTAHELNQPLMVLMGNIQLMEMDGDIPEHLTDRLRKINAAAGRMSDIVKKIQMLRHDQPKSYAGGKTILNLDQQVSILSVEGRDEDFNRIQAALKGHELLRLSRVKTLESALAQLKTGPFDLIFLITCSPTATASNSSRPSTARAIETPVVVITGQGDELIASRIIQAGASDYLPSPR